MIGIAEFDERANSLHQHREDFSFLLERFISNVAGVVVAELATADGLPVSVAGAERDNADRLAAMGAGLHSLAQGLEDGDLRQSFIETSTTRIFVMSAASGSVLIVVTRVDADANLIGHEMVSLIASVRAHLATPARSAVEPAAGLER